jgi:polyphosphate kinase
VVEKRARALVADQQRVWLLMRRQLNDAGIVVCETASLNAQERVWLDGWFMNHVFPVLTPLAIDPAHPFPFIPNMGLVIVLKLHVRCCEATCRIPSATCVARRGQSRHARADSVTAAGLCVGGGGCDVYECKRR